MRDRAWDADASWVPVFFFFLSFFFFFLFFKFLFYFIDAVLAYSYTATTSFTIVLAMPAMLLNRDFLKKKKSALYANYVYGLQGT